MRRRFAVVPLCVLLAGWLDASARAGAAVAPSPQQAELREIFKELIEINTTDSTGDNTRAAAAMAARLRAAGLPARDVQVLAPHPRKGNLVARLRGSGRARPLLLLAHLDVVEARREDWSFDPFKLVERDGYFYGRGTTDDKSMAAVWVSILIRLRREGFVADRDLIVALTADEEDGDYNGVDWLVEQHRDLIDAEFCLNEGGEGQIKGGKYVANALQASEKLYQSFTLTVTNPGGHSSRPVKDNAIYHLAAGLVRLSAFEFPITLNEVTRGFFARMAPLADSPANAAAMRALAKSPTGDAAARLAASSSYYNALLRTTCAPTRLLAGHAENALPQTATAVLNCRLLPGADAAAVQRTLATVLGDSRIALATIGAPRGNPPPSPLRPDLMAAIEQITQAMWPGVTVIPTMGTGATDGRRLRLAGIPTYGVPGIFEDVDDNRAHGKDERLAVRSLYEGQEFLFRLIKRLAKLP